MEIKLDLHVHTSYSRDCITEIDEIVEQCHQNGLDGYAITDHDTVEGTPEALSKKDDLIVIRGLEVTANGGHILALGIEKPIPPNLPMKETVDHIHKNNGIAILAHPYGLPRSWIRIPEVKKAEFDAIEVANASQIPFSYIRDKNQELANRLDMPVIGGSDSHLPETVGRCYTVINSRSGDVSDILNAIVLGQTMVYGSGITFKERIKKILKEFFC